MRWIVAFVVWLAGWCACGETASAQFMFLDSNGDGQSTSEDRLRAKSSTRLDLWVVTDQDRQGRHVSSPLGEGALTINSYEVVLEAVGGTVAWGTYVNAQSTMSTSFGRHESATELHVGYGGMETLAPGKHKLGTLEVQVVSGDPRIEFRARSTIQAGAYTSFGSKMSGRDGDHTLKLVSDVGDQRHESSEGAGDWRDASGLGKSMDQALVGRMNETQLRFAVGVQSKARGGFQFTITTTRPGLLELTIYDVHGRAARKVVSDTHSPAGQRIVEVEPEGLASGIYVYRLTTVDGSRSGRLALIK